MKTLIQLVLVAALVGGASAVGTVFWQSRMGAPIAAGSDGAPHDQAAATDAATPTDAEPTPADAATSHAAVDDHAVPPSPAGDENPLAAAEPPRTHLEVPGGAADAPHPSPDRGEAPIAIRPPYTPEGDEGGALINLLRERARTAVEKERRMAERQDAIKLIFDDLRAEQAQTLRIREQLMKELQASRQAVDSALQAIDSERNSLRLEQAEIRKSTEEALRAANDERDKLKKQLEKATSPAPEKPPESAEDNANLKKMAAVFDSMPADNVAKVFEQLVKNKRTDAVVALMNSMKERQAAKVLAVIAETNTALAADLADRLKRLKSSTVPPAAE